MKAYGGVDVQTHIFLTSVLAGDEWPASHPGSFIPGEWAPGTHWIGGCMDPRAGLDVVEKKKFLTSPGLKLPVASRYPGPFYPWYVYESFVCGTRPRIWGVWKQEEEKMWT
jgi:hypothetical protein